MAVDTRFVVDSFALCSRFAALGITEGENALLPRSYQRVQTNYLKQNRKEQFAVNYGGPTSVSSFRNRSMFLPVATSRRLFR